MGQRDRLVMHNPLGDTGITPKLKQWLQDHPFWEAETRQDKLDQFIFAVFPFFVAFFGLLAVAMFFVYWIDNLTVGHLLYSLCVCYTLCFVILGIPTVFLSDHSIIKTRYIATGLSLMAILIGLLFWSVFNPDNGDLYEFMSGFYWFISYLGVDINIYTTVIGVLVILHTSVLVSYGDWPSSSHTSAATTTVSSSPLRRTTNPGSAGPPGGISRSPTSSMSTKSSWSLRWTIRYSRRTSSRGCSGTRSSRDSSSHPISS